MDREEETQRNREAEHRGLESRITAGPISDIIAPSLVHREGFAIILGMSKRIDDRKWIKSFELHLECGDYYDEIGAHEAINPEPLEIRRLNEGLRGDNLYLSNFQATLPPDKNPQGLWVLGQGEVYSDREISVDESGSFEIISKPASR
ncbi:MAG: hypothetical protein AABW89_01515 [Nanoarchaeota archaeon]